MEKKFTLVLTAQSESGDVTCVHILCSTFSHPQPNNADRKC